MGQTIQDVTDAELAVLRYLWDHGSSSIRQIADIVYPRGRASDYATVQKLLERLEFKGAVARQRTTPAHVFTAAICRDTLIGHRLRQIADKVCCGSFTPILSHLVRNERLNKEDIKALRAILHD